MQINRMFEIVHILLEKNRVTSIDLAEHFGVSTRTISRDVDALSAAGIPVYTERGKRGGISLLPDFVLNKSLLTETEQNEILSALTGLASIKTTNTGRTLRKLSNTFGKAAENWMEVDFSEWADESDFFGDFKAAILERRVTVFDYYNQHGDKTSRRAEPLQLYFKSKAWYLKAFCLTKQEVRLYKISRIKNLILTDEVFTKRDSLNVSGNPILNMQDGGDLVDIKLRIEPKMAYRVFDYFHEDMVEKQPDGAFIVNASWREDNWLYGFILSFGSNIEVLEPEHIRTVIKTETKKIAEKYL